MSGLAGLFNKKNIYLGRPKVGGAGDGKHTKNTATLIHMNEVTCLIYMLCVDSVGHGRGWLDVYTDVSRYGWDY